MERRGEQVIRKIDMQPGANGVPAFLRLGRVSKFFRGFAPALRFNSADAAYVRRVIEHDEIFTAKVPLEGDCELARYARKWMDTISHELGVDIGRGAVNQTMEVLEFAGVGEHTDGFLEAGRQRGDVHEKVLHNYCNVQLRGSGWLVVDGSRHRIDAGEAYVFDQSLVHEWVQESQGTSRMASFRLEYQVIRDWLANARSRPMQRQPRKIDRSGKPVH
jgi:hypothetical protein